MKIPVDPGGELPLYLQIERWIRRGIAAARLRRGLRLPSSRALARGCGVARITAETAYARLEADGLIEARPGSGTYVAVTAAEAAAAPAPALPAEHGARRPGWAAGVAPGEGGRRARRPANAAALLAFEHGLGDPRTYPVAELRRELNRVLRDEPEAAHAYGEPAGHPPLRANIATVLAARGLAVGPENVLVTSGSQQGIALTAALLARPGDSVVVESPCYAGALRSFRALGLRPIGVPVDGEGMDVAALEALLERCRGAARPRFVYTIPTFQNPTGTCLSGARRRRLLKAAARAGVLLLEDDFVGDLRYDGPALPDLAALDGDRVVHVGTFSKMLMPGLRIGYLVARAELVARLTELKEAHDLASCHPVQRALHAFIRAGRYEAHLRRACRLYRARRDAMREAVRRHLPRAEALAPPRGGLYLWLRLPGGVDAEALLNAARRAGVTFAPGRPFFAGEGAGRSFLRLNFAMRTPEEIDEGLRRLAQALRRHGRHGREAAAR